MYTVETAVTTAVDTPVKEGRKVTKEILVYYICYCIIYR
jgi:hypothetical protein